MMKILLLVLPLAGVVFAQIPTTIQTHSDLIPVYGSASTIQATKSGEWQTPTTWDAWRLPNAGAAVYVPQGLSVHGTGQLAALDIVVSGKLTLDSGFDLLVRTITVLPTGDLSVSGPHWVQAQEHVRVP